MVLIKDYVHVISIWTFHTKKYAALAFFNYGPPKGHEYNYFDININMM